MAAVLLPFSASGEIDWSSTEALIARTLESGLTPAVNMDTGYVQMLDARSKLRVLDIAAEVTSGNFVAGAYVADTEGDSFDLDAYLAAATAIASRGGTPVIFPSNGLNGGCEETWVEALTAIGANLDRFLGFELGSMFVPYGRIYSLDAYRAMLDIYSCIGAKHSSLNRELEWQRLALRDEVRPDFMVLTGNDLAIDMVMYGSDYLLDWQLSPLICSPNGIGCGRLVRLGSINSMTRFSISASSRSVPRYPHIATTRQCFCNSAAGRNPTTCQPARPVAQTRTEPSCAT